MIYFIEAVGINRIKIGFSRDRQRVFSRLTELEKQAPTKMRLLAFVAGSMDLERSLHHAFRRSRAVGEWFHATPRLRELADTLAPINGQDASETIKAVISSEDLEARTDACMGINQNSNAEQAVIRARHAVAAFVVKHGIAATSQITGCNNDTVRLWMKGSSAPRFPALAGMVRWDSDLFAGTPFAIRDLIAPEPNQRSVEDRFNAVHAEIEELRKLVGNPA